MDCRRITWRKYTRKTLEEPRANLHEAIQLTLKANRALAEEYIAELEEVIREPIFVRL